MRLLRGRSQVFTLRHDKDGWRHASMCPCSAARQSISRSSRLGEGVWLRGPAPPVCSPKFCRPFNGRILPDTCVTPRPNVTPGVLAVGKGAHGANAPAHFQNRRSMTLVVRSVSSGPAGNRKSPAILPDPFPGTSLLRAPGLVVELYPFCGRVPRIQSLPKFVYGRT